MPIRSTTRTNYKHDDYWKIKDGIDLTAKQMKELLDERKYVVNASVGNKRAFGTAVRRSDLGLISYDQCTDHELAEFIKARGIIYTGRGRSRRTNLDLLTSADRHLEFHGFLKLPPEIRNRIYGMYYAEFSEPIYAPTPPPLTRSCSLVRKEALQMFYGSCTFMLVILHKLAENLSSSSPPRPASRDVLKIPSQSLQFLYGTPPAHLALVRRFVIRIGLDLSTYHDRFPKPPSDAQAFGCTFELPEHEDGRTKLFIPSKQKLFEYRRARLAPVLRGMRTRISMRESRGSLTLEDVLWLRAKLEVAFR